jgi:alpha-beta hydrolase superfamily lysophospholipase
MSSRSSPNERHEVPYGEHTLSAMRLAPRHGQTPKGSVLIHGGVDSFIEEFYCFWEAFAEAGYEVVAFDGPGQGATLHRYGVASDHDWEEPVGAVLDHFQMSDVTLLGISFGGYWCVRAAAFEKRITRLIIHAPFYDLMEVRVERPGIVGHADYEGTCILGLAGCRLLRSSRHKHHQGHRHDCEQRPYPCTIVH